MSQVHRIAPAPPAPTLEHGAAAFVAAHTAGPGAWAPGTAKKYRETFTALGLKLHSPTASDLAALDAEAGRAQLKTAFDSAVGHLAPATYARHLSTLRSAVAWWRASGWLTGDPTAGWARPKIPVDTTRALTRDQIDALLKLDAALREKTLWRLIYETAARAEEVLSLDAGDLDLPNKRARVISKGGATERVHWQTGAAILLPRLLAGRERGPVFLADRLPTRPVASLDLCPVTGRARLSYRRAAEIFEETTRRLAHPHAPAANLAELGGWTLHQLRHSQLTHEAENGTNTPTLLARSRHASVRSLERYARPGPEAVAKHVAATDPAARRRSPGSH